MTIRHRLRRSPAMARALSRVHRDQLVVAAKGRRLLRDALARMGFATGSGSVVIGSGMHPVRVVGRDHLSVTTAQATNVEAVTRALTAHGIAFAVLPQVADASERIVVSAADGPAACRALAAGFDDAWWVSTGRQEHRHRPIRTLVEAVPLPPGLTVFRFWASHDGTVVIGREAGARIEFWRPVAPLPGTDPVIPANAATDETATSGENPDADGKPATVGWRDLAAPTANGFSDRLSARVWSAAQRRPDHHVTGIPHLLTPRFPIDLVYTWVDGSDPDWRARFAAAWNDDGVERHASAAAASRYAERDELRYSLRSVEMYADWVHHIYLVTDRQVPDWLRTDHDRLTVVDHTEIFADADALPVFNSHAIEAQLHHIPGLSEHYLYLNDDVFFGSPVTPGHFFHANGLATFFLSEHTMGADPVMPADLPVTAAAKNGRALIESLFGRTVTHKFQHTPHPQLRSVLDELEDRATSEFTAVTRARFRGPEDISVAAALHHYYAYATGRAVPGALRYQFFDLADPDTVAELAKLAIRRNLEVFCLNDTHSDEAELARQQQVIRHFCEAYFPEPSSFEIT